MWCVTADPTLAKDIFWHCSKTIPFDGNTVKFTVNLQVFYGYFRQCDQRKAEKEAARILKRNKVSWIIPQQGTWFFDLDEFGKSHPELSEVEWLRGMVQVDPRFETAGDERPTVGTHSFTISEKNLQLAFYIKREVVQQRRSAMATPVEIEESLARFKFDHPDEGRACLIMMQFGTTLAHHDIVKATKRGLEQFGIAGVRADEKEYHTDLFYNVMTYIYGCGLGIAVFERIEADDFNPNVSLEVGYMLALGKPVCLLKERTLRTLHSDLVGKLYRTFDLHDPLLKIPDEISQWLRDKGLTPGN